jgi:hypothetical protein
MANEEMWDKLFERVSAFRSEVEAAIDIAATVEKKAEVAIDAAVDGIDIALYVLTYSFLIRAIDHPEQARKEKDLIVRDLKEGFPRRPRAVGLVEKYLTQICDLVEKELL